MGKAVTGAAANAATPDGRNHWQWCWSGLFSGAGVRGGQLIGESDEWAGYPNSKAFYPSDMGATIYQAMGIPLASEVRDLQDRPMAITHGNVMKELL